MAVHLLIDGYNLIRGSSVLRSEEEVAIELGRKSLLERLRRYKQAQHHRITVVFDAESKVHLAPEVTREKGIRVIYSGRGETADAVMKRICQNEGGKLTVVTSDRELARYAEACGALTIGAGEFEERVEMALYLDAKGGEEEEIQPWKLGSGTRKKGPSRRLSKKERKRRQRWRKL